MMRFQLDLDRIEQNVIHRLLHGAGPESDYYILFNQYPTSGFSNHVRTLIGSIVLSLVSGRRLRSFVDSSFSYS